MANHTPQSISDLIPPNSTVSDEAVAGAWAEAANDPQGWSALLNTYYKLGNGSIERGIKKYSMAVRNKDPQYRKIKEKFNEFSPFELRRAEDLVNTMHEFVPDKNWDRMNHEAPNLDMYTSAARAKGTTAYQEMINQLSKRKDWQDVDFSSGEQYGRQVYFRKKQTPSRVAVMSGMSAQQLQLGLANAGMDVGAIDGKIGARTTAAIRQFQRLNGLKADGIVGPKTIKAISPYVSQGN